MVCLGNYFSYLTLIVYKNITIIKYNHVEETRNGTKGGSGLQQRNTQLLAIYSVIIIHGIPTPLKRRAFAVQ